MWGNVGWKFFDRKRHIFMGIALVVTLVTMIITSAGAFSLSTNSQVIRNTYWAKATAFDINTTAFVQTAYLGLNTLVLSTCIETERIDDASNAYARECVRVLHLQ